MASGSSAEAFWCTDATRASRAPQTMLLQRLKSQADSVGELIEPELVLAEVEELPEGASEVRAWPAACCAVCHVLCLSAGHQLATRAPGVGSRSPGPDSLCPCAMLVPLVECARHPDICTWLPRTLQEQRAAHEAAVAENAQRKAAHDAAMEEFRVASAGGISQQQLVRWYLETMVQRWAAGLAAHTCCSGTLLGLAGWLAWLLWWHSHHLQQGLQHGGAFLTSCTARGTLPHAACRPAPHASHCCCALLLSRPSYALPCSAHRHALESREQAEQEYGLVVKIVARLIKKDSAIVVVHSPAQQEGESAEEYRTRANSDRLLALAPNFDMEA